MSAVGAWQTALKLSTGPATIIMTGSPVLPAIGASGAIRTVDRASGSPSLPRVASAATIKVVDRASGSPSLPPIGVPAGDVQTVVRMAANANLPALGSSGSFEVIERILFDGSPSLPPIGVTAHVAVVDRATASPSLRALTSTAVVRVVDRLDGSGATLPRIASTGHFDLGAAIDFAGSPVLPALVAGGVMRVVGRLNGSGATLPRVEAAGTMVFSTSFHGSPTLRRLTSSGTLRAVDRLRANPALLPRIQSTAHVATVISGSGDAVLPALTGGTPSPPDPEDDMGAKKVLINSLNLGTSSYTAGAEFDATDDAARITDLQAAGAVLLPKDNALVASVQVQAQALKARGGPSLGSSFTDMFLAALIGASFSQKVSVTLVDGVGVVNTGITVTANTVALPSLKTPAGTMGTSLKAAYVVGAPGTGSVTLTAVDDAGATVTTDDSVYDVLLFG